MKTMYMLVGLPGSGKSTWARNCGLPIVSSDEYRKQHKLSHSYSSTAMWNDLIEQANSLESDFVFDATNLVRKNRMRLLRKIHCAAKAIIFPTSFLECLARNAAREEPVPEYAIYQMRERFTMPQLEEGFADIQYAHFNFNSSKMRELYELIEDFGDQHNPHHHLSLYAHSVKVAQIVTNRLRSVAFLHDCGKPYCVSKDEDGTYHYYNHANVGAYEMLTAGCDPYYVSLVELHMRPFNSLNKPQGISDLLWKDVLLLHEADLLSEEETI